MEVTDEQMCEAVVEGLAAEPYVSSSQAYAYYEEVCMLTQEDIDLVIERMRERDRERNDRIKRELEQRLAEKMALIASLEDKIAALEYAQMCEAVVNGLADDAHGATPLTPEQAARFRFWQTQKYDETAFNEAMERHFLSEDR